MASKSLKRGFTTGAAAAAAAHAALDTLLRQKALQENDERTVPPDAQDTLWVTEPDAVEIRCLNDEWISIPIHRVRCLSSYEAEGIVIKDAGDDPDVTHKAEIGARVRLVHVNSKTKAGTRTTSRTGKDAVDTVGTVGTAGTVAPTEGIVLLMHLDQQGGNPEKMGAAPLILLSGGEGVGRVTKPGLEILPGEPAINLGPRTMIKEAVERVLETFPLPAGRAVEVEVFVPEGALLAERTLNARLGILGGISILGTTGIVRPMSHDAYIATIRSGISVARSMACDTLVFTTGRRSERFAMDRFPDLPEEAFIQIGDFFKASLEAASGTHASKTHAHENLGTDKTHIHNPHPPKPNDHSGIKTVVITVFFGKAVKMAMGFPHTHAAKSELTMKKLARWADEITGDKPLHARVLQANTARHAFEDIYPDFPQLIAHVGKMIIRSARKFTGSHLTIRSIIFDFEGNLIFDSMNRFNSTDQGS